MVHQISPKKGGIYYGKYDERLVYVTELNGDMIAHMNIFRLQELVYASYVMFKKRIENNEWEKGCKNLMDCLLSKQDGFLDNNILQYEYQKLGELKVLLNP